jgi:hypothetical protein|tara:strand:- start:443 stop:1447 length:1005 start_codon:yes stop_codon:yes gene_type:complete
MGIETAIIGSAILGAAGSAYGAKKSSDAAKTAAAAQTDAAEKQVDLSREIYYDQRGLQQPYYQAGLQGMYGDSGLMNLLGHTTPGGTTQAPANQNVFASGSYGTGQISQPQSGPDWGAYLQANPDVAQYYQNNPKSLQQFGGDINKAAEYHYNTFGRSEGRELPQYETQNVFSQPQTQQAVETPQKTTVTDQSGTDSGLGSMTETLRQTPGYQFMQDEATKSLENSFASRGKLLSGAAMSALQDRSMGLADQTYQQSVNNNFNLANIGMGSAAQMQSAGNVFANSANTAYGNMGTAAANSAYGQASAWNSGMQGVYDSAMGGLGAYGSYKGWGT